MAVIAGYGAQCAVPHGDGYGTSERGLELQVRSAALCGAIRLAVNETLPHRGQT